MWDSGLWHSKILTLMNLFLAKTHSSRAGVRVSISKHLALSSVEIVLRVLLSLLFHKMQGKDLRCLIKPSQTIFGMFLLNLRIKLLSSIRCKKCLECRRRISQPTAVTLPNLHVKASAKDFSLFKKEMQIPIQISLLHPKDSIMLSGIILSEDRGVSLWQALPKEQATKIH